MDRIKTLQSLSSTQLLNSLRETRQTNSSHPQHTLAIGVHLLLNHRWSIGDSYWQICQDIFYAAINCNYPDWVQYTIDQLSAKFPKSPRIARMKGIMLQYQGNFIQALQLYQQVLQAHPQDAMALKRKISIYRTQGQIKECVKEMNSYLESFQGDVQAWQELTDLYLESQHFSQAAYCYQEVVLNCPENCWIMIKYGEILYSTGNSDKIYLSRKYFTQALVLNKKSIRALWNLWQCCKRIQSIKNEELNVKLMEKAERKLKVVYKDLPFNVLEVFGDK